jgi:nucleoside-diphosphate-sugar epimerase
LQIKVARIFNTYGPRMHPNDGRVVSNSIVQALLGRDITVYGDGSQTRSFCYVDDLIDGLVRLMATASRGDRSSKYWQSHGILDAGTGHDGDQSDRLALAHCSLAPAGGRSAPTPPRHFARPGPARLEAAHHA